MVYGVVVCALVSPIMLASDRWASMTLLDSDQALPVPRWESRVYELGLSKSRHTNEENKNKKYQPGCDEEQETN